MSATDETKKAAPKPRGFYLVYSLPDRATVRVSLDEDSAVTFGRADSDVIVDDALVSRKHAVVRRSSAGLTLRDLGSRNGTTVCGEVLHEGERRLGAGDVFDVGPMNILVVSTDAAGERCVVADPAMRKIHAALQRVARRRAPVLLLGEPGVGKAVLAEQLHDASSRTDKPFVRFDCASPRTREHAEAELFGDRGLVVTAHEGTLMLSEIGELPQLAQQHLVRFLKARVAEPDVRLVCSSSAEDLLKQLDAELNVLIGTVSITVPPLRERKLEIPVLADHVLQRLARTAGIAAPSITREAAALLTAHAWPRNIDDLHDVIEVALALSDDGRITPSELPPAIAGTREPASAPRRDAVVLRISSGGESFRLAAAPEVSLARRGPLRRVLLHLVNHRESVAPDDLFAAGWPGERPVHQSREGRLRTAIWALRRMGFQDLLITRDDGYLLAPNVEIEWT